MGCEPQSFPPTIQQQQAIPVVFAPGGIGVQQCKALPVYVCNLEDNDGGASPFTTAVVNVPVDQPTVEAALASITDNSALVRYTILLAPGVYPQENNPLTLKEYVTIVSVGGKLTSSIGAANANADMFIGANVSGIYGVTISGVSGAAYYGVRMDVPGNFDLIDVTFVECSNGALLDNAGAGMTARRIGGVALGGAIGDLITVRAGRLNGGDFEVAAVSTINTILRVDGADSYATVNSLISSSPNVSNGIVASNNSSPIIRAADISGADYGVVFGGGSNCRLIGSRITNCSAVGFSIPDGVTTVGISSTEIVTNTVDAVISSPDAVVFGDVTARISNAVMHQDASIHVNVTDLLAGDEGFNVLGELHVGMPERPTESVFGGGDSYTRGMLVYTFDGSTYTDVSADAAASSGSPFTFPNNNANTALYVASSLSSSNVLHHHGIKVLVTTAAVLGAGEIMAEYWNGVAWVAFTHMTTQSGGQYLPLANHIFENTGSYQIRNNIFMDADWDTSDDPGYGTPLYWVRYRIATAITAAPIFEQFKLHTSRAELNSDGYLEFMGTGRPFARLPWDAGLLRPAASSPANQDLFLSDFLDVGRVENRFVNGATDRMGFLSPVPFEIDTSTPIVFMWSVISDDATAGNVDWTVRWGVNTHAGNVYRSQSAAPATAPGEQSISHVSPAPATADTVLWYQARLDISSVIPRRTGGFFDTLWVSLERSGGSGDDTHGGDVVLIAIAANYLTWCIGGHV